MLHLFSTKTYKNIKAKGNCVPATVMLTVFLHPPWSDWHMYPPVSDGMASKRVQLPTRHGPGVWEELIFLRVQPLWLAGATQIREMQSYRKNWDLFSWMLSVAAGSSNRKLKASHQKFSIHTRNYKNKKKQKSRKYTFYSLDSSK